MPKVENERHDLPHNLILEGRGRLSVSGVLDVDSFNDESVILYTSQGVLTITGNELRIERLTIDGGEMNIDGIVDSLVYTDDHAEKGSLWSRIFR